MVRLVALLSAACLSVAAYLIWWMPGRPAVRTPEVNVHVSATRAVPAPASRPTQPRVLGVRPEAPLVAVAPSQAPKQPDPTFSASNALERKVFAASSFDAEMFDGKWSRHAEMSLSSKLGSIKQSEVAVTKVECRTTLCRFNVTGSSDVGTQTFLRSMIRSNIGAGMAVPADENAPEDNSRVTVYVVREGYPLPEPPSGPDLQETAP